jgi:hypothetical protein
MSVIADRVAILQAIKRTLHSYLVCNEVPDVNAIEELGPKKKNKIRLTLIGVK